MTKLFKQCVCSHDSHKHRLNGGGCTESKCLCTRLRPYNGLTLREAARRTAIEPSALSRFLSGKRTLNHKSFYKLWHDVLQVQPEDLLASVVDSQHQA